MSLGSRIATPEGKGEYVKRLFATIADKYDFITVVLSWGQDRRWKARLGQMADVQPDESALDLACGTGDIALIIAARAHCVVGLDLTPRMVRLAQAKSDGSGATFLVGDMMALPFAEASFDLVTTGYGIRNVPRLSDALGEIYRVLRPGGRFLSLDFNRPESPLVRGLYLGYLTVVGSLLGLILHGDPDTYRYIPASIRQYPGAPSVARMMRERGFATAQFVPVLGGLMAIHIGRKAACHT